MILTFILMLATARADYIDNLFNSDIETCPKTRTEFENRLQHVEHELLAHTKTFSSADWGEQLLSQTLEGQLITFFIADRAPVGSQFAKIAAICVPSFKKFEREITKSNLDEWQNCVKTQYHDPLLVPEQIKTCFDQLY